MRTLAFATLALLGIAPAAAQPAAEEVFDSMVAAFESRSLGIDNYTVVSDGFTTHYRRAAVGGATKYEVGTEVGNLASGNMTTRFGLDNPYLLRERFSAGASVSGQIELGEETVWALSVDPPPSGDVESMTLFVDSDAWFIRGADVEVEDDGSTRRMEIRFEDFRDTDGVWYPWITRIQIPDANAGIDQAELDKARAAIEQMESRLAQMPAAQADMIRARMEESLRRIEGMAAGEGMTVTYTVSEVRVNQGVPSHVF